MPTYEYRCNSCEEITEIFHGMNEEPRKVCPECGENALTRIIGTPDWILKGQGWARDGYSNSTKSRYDKK